MVGNYEDRLKQEIYLILSKLILKFAPSHGQKKYDCFVTKTTIHIINIHPMGIYLNLVN